MGARLFDRSKRPVELMPAGHALWPQARALLAQAERTSSVNAALLLLGGRRSGSRGTGVALAHELRLVRAASPASAVPGLVWISFQA